MTVNQDCNLVVATVFFPGLEENLYYQIFFHLKSFTTVWLNVLQTGGFLFDAGGSVTNDILGFSLLTWLLSYDSVTL